MVDDRGRAGDRAQTWPPWAARPWRAWPWLAWRGDGAAARALADRFGRLRSAGKEAIAADFGAGRLAPWMPVAFGLGVAVYFTAEHEPAWAAAAVTAAGAATLAYCARRRPLAFPLLALAAAACAGFAIVTLKTELIAHPVLERSAYGVKVTGFVEAREERARTDRIVVRVSKFEGGRVAQPPQRVRVSVRRGTAPLVGSFISFSARLNPPLKPLRPGGYDFARDLYFQRIGAVGFVTGSIATQPPPAPPDVRLRYASFIDGVREAIDKRIRAAASGDAGAIASALITGKRDAISDPVNNAMYVSSLAHVLSISGYHMAVVAGVVFFIVRAGLALVPGLASRRPIKKWGAVVALMAAACYLALSGAEVATQRAFIMTAIVLVGVMADRAALTLRTLAVAAIAVLLVAPEAVVHPSFQMSFAATLALVAAYERGMPWVAAGGNTTLSARVALWGGREVVALLFASLVAGAATTPYAAFHFHRIAPYGVLANLLAMPIVSAWVMPAGLAALVLMPFGFDAPLWRLMAAGIDWMVAVALWVTSLPGALGRVPAFGVGLLLLATAGLILVCLLRSRLRWLGAALVVVSSALAAVTPRPDILLSDGAAAVAVRGPDGSLSAIKLGSDAFAIREWLAADGDARAPNDPKLGSGFACDDTGCVAELTGGAIVAVARSAQALAEDCGRAAVVITARSAPPDCASRVIDRDAVRGQGAMALYREDGQWRIEAARPRGISRPWASTTADGGDASRRVASPPRIRDATPREEDIELDD